MNRISLVVITVIFFCIVFVQISCKKEDPTELPTVKTLPVIEISSSTAKSGGNITNDVGSEINSKGVVWSTNMDPSIENHAGITMEGVGDGIFISTLTNLSPATHYYVRAYATSSVGTAYGNHVHFTTTGSFLENYPSGYVHCNSANPTAIVEVTNPKTGRIWMDRNLGASRAATSSTDAGAYGDLYQWGRFADGHQCRTSDVISTLSSIDQPGHGKFIASDMRNWRNPKNDHLWQVESRVNNPCPNGYRVPTAAEWNAETLFWSSKNANGAFASPLRLPVTGYRHYADGSFFRVNSEGFYWSSTANPWSSSLRYGETYFLHFNNSSANVFSWGLRQQGYSVRCVKDQ